jgi:hypothetical protein
LVGEALAYERIVAGGLAAVKIHSIRPPTKLADAVPVLLAVGLARVIGLQAVEPAALIRGVEHAAGNQCLDPGGEIVGGRDDAPDRRGKGMVQASVVVERPRSSRLFECPVVNLLEYAGDFLAPVSFYPGITLYAAALESIVVIHCFSIYFISSVEGSRHCGFFNKAKLVVLIGAFRTASKSRRMFRSDSERPIISPTVLDIQ